MDNTYHNIVNNLAKNLNLPALGPYDQDWEYVVSDSSKIEEFIAYYENKTSIKWEKQILMAIIISSFDDSICDNSFNKELWSKTESILFREFEIHKEELEYWANYEEYIELEDCFSITPYIRGIIEKHGNEFIK